MTSDALDDMLGPGFTEGKRADFKLHFSDPSLRYLKDVQVRLSSPQERAQFVSETAPHLYESFISKPQERTTSPSVLLSELRCDQQMALRAKKRASFRRRPSRKIKRDHRIDHLPGVLAGIALVKAELARRHEIDIAEVREASDEAVKACDLIKNPLARAGMLRQLSQIWAPSNSLQDPVNDFKLSVKLLKRCIELEGGEDSAINDSISYLARAYRYVNHYQESKRLYRMALERETGSRHINYRANILFNLAELEVHIGQGPRRERYQEAIRLYKEAIELTTSLRMKNEFMNNLGLVQTQIVPHLELEERIPQLKCALETFDQIDLSHCRPHFKGYYSNNRSSCESLLHRMRGEPHRSVEVLLHEIESTSDPLLRATAQHNLGVDLCRAPLMELERHFWGISLLVEAFDIRSIGCENRHYWETSYELAHALWEALIFDMSYRSFTEDQHCILINQLYDTLNEAASAAKRLGPGQEGLDVAFLRCKTAITFLDLDGIQAQCERAWEVVNEAAGYMLLRPDLVEKESTLAQEVAFKIAYLIMGERDSQPDPYLFALIDEDATLIERWTMRSQQSTRRLLNARLSHPHGVSSKIMSEWRSALQIKNQNQINRTLEDIRITDPSFLIEDQVSEATWLWLEAEPNRVAVSMSIHQGPDHQSSPCHILVLSLSPSGERLRSLIGLKSRCLSSLDSDLLRQVISETSGSEAEEYIQPYFDMHNEAHEFIIKPILDYLNNTPSQVLWNPPAKLRLLSPSLLWREIPAVVTCSLTLPNLREAPERSPSALIAIADPGKNKRDLTALDKHGSLTARRLHNLLSCDSEMMVSVGSQHGSLLTSHTSPIREQWRDLPLIDEPASPQSILKRAAQHQLIVVMAHGEVPSTHEAQLICLDERGEMTPLTIDHLESHPEAFTNATVLLLSCSSGQIGETQVSPGGIAGALISSGARCVIAPLWPVNTEVALGAAESVIEAINRGDDPTKALSRWQNTSIMSVSDAAPQLGRRPQRSRSHQVESEVIQRLSFVSWVG